MSLDVATLTSYLPCMLLRGTNILPLVYILQKTHQGIRYYCSVLQLDADADVREFSCFPPVCPRTSNSHGQRGVTLDTNVRAGASTRREPGRGSQAQAVGTGWPVGSHRDKWWWSKGGRLDACRWKRRPRRDSRDERHTSLGQSECLCRVGLPCWRLLCDGRGSRTER